MFGEGCTLKRAVSIFCLALINAYCCLCREMPLATNRTKVSFCFNHSRRKPPDARKSFPKLLLAPAFFVFYPCLAHRCKSPRPEIDPSLPNVNMTIMQLRMSYPENKIECCLRCNMASSSLPQCLNAAAMEMHTKATASSTQEEVACECGCLPRAS